MVCGDTDGVCYTSFLAHFPDFSIKNPMMHLNSSREMQTVNRGMMGISVSRDRMSPVGTLTAHTKAESKRKVMKV